jgi:hypothetical protein
VEPLENRYLLAVITNPAPGVIQIDTDGAAEQVVIEDAPGVNNSQVSVDGGTPQVFTNPDSLLIVNTGGGDDTIVLKNLETSFGAEALLNGGNGNDTFRVVPNQTGKISVNGGPPALNDPGTPPGDVLALDLDNVIGAAIQAGDTAGQIVSISHAPVQWLGIEEVITPDRLEYNDSVQQATVLGSVPKVTLNDLSIHPRLDQSTGIPFADVVVVVDESGSMNTEHQFLADFVPGLESALLGIGIGGLGTFGENQYGLVGFGGGEGEGGGGHLPGHAHLVGGSLFGSSTEFVTATGTLVLTGADEDGYDGIDYALNNYPFRPDATKLVIVVTDEDRDVVNGGLSFGGISAALQAAGVTLHGIFDVNLEDGNAVAALAVDGDGTAYLADGSGGVLQSTGGVATGGFGSTISDYVNLVFTGNGLVGDLNQLRQGGNFAESFSSAMLIGLINTIDIDPPAPDQDFYQYTAPDTGMLIVNAFFDHDIGDVDMRVLDGNGNLIASSTSVTDDERIAIPVVSQEQYFIQVYGVNEAVNNYALEIENFAAPVPDAPWLDPRDDTGISTSDNVTAENEARIIIEADLAGFTGNIPILSPEDVTAGASGAAVRVIVNGSAVGYATPIAGTNNTLFEYTFTAGQLSSTFIPTLGGGGLNGVKAAVVIFDGQAPHASGRTRESSPLLVTLDQSAPSLSLPVLLGSSDTGTPGDGVTGQSSPAFTGAAEENARVRLYAIPAGDTPNLANAWLIGEGAATGIHASQGLGTWEITSEPLADGAYDIFTVVIDAAGNASDVSVETPVASVVIDSVTPQRPTIDLLDYYDTGASATDNNTRLDVLGFRVTGDPGETTVVKDGNTVIATFLMPGSGETFVIFDFVFLTGTTGFWAEGSHPLSAEATDLAGNRSAQSEELLVTIDQTAPSISVPDMLASSDTGAFDDDNVTGEASPAFQGTVGLYAPEAGLRVFLESGDSILGSTDLLLDTFDFPGNGQVIENDEGNGSEMPTVAWEITSEPLDDGLYLVTARVQDLAGNFALSGPLTIYVDTLEPNTPLLDLVTPDDSGHTETDNITNVNVPLLSMTTHEPNAADHPIAENFRYRVYDRFNDGGTEVLIFDSSTVTATAGTGGFTALAQVFSTDDLLAGATLIGLLADGVHDLKLEVEDRAGNISHDFLLDLVVDTVAPPADVNLLDSSDTGISDSDNVTNMAQPAFDGRSEVNAKVFIYAQQIVDGNPVGGPMLVGEGRVDSDTTDVVYAIPGASNDDGLGMWEVTVEPLDDGVYDITSFIEDAAGNASRSEPLRIWVDTVAPNTPYLDLVEASDTGRSDSDNVTNDNTPTVTVTADDTLDGDGNPFWHEIHYRIYDRPDLVGNDGEVLLVDSLITNPGLSTGGFFTEILGTLADGVTEYSLPDGVHNLKLEVEDRAGNVSHDFLLTVVIDTVAPPVTINRIDPATTDTGVVGYPDTFVDRVTSDTTTGFVGNAEADAIVRMWADGALVSDGVVDQSDVFQGLTVAIPLDGNLAFPNGQWNLAGQHDLNNPTVGFPLDGLRQIGVNAEDLAGNVSEYAFLDVFIDTQGPQIKAIYNPDAPLDDLFDPKPSQTGPTPLIYKLAIDVKDLPNRSGADANFLYDALLAALAEDPGHYSLVGDANGVIPIGDVTFDPDEVVADKPATATITLHFLNPLPDDRFTLTVSDSLADRVGNALDGESNAVQPLEAPKFSSGDGVPGGDFVARFTVDSRPEIGTWAAGSVYIDTNGNFSFDPNNVDATNRDLVYVLGYASDFIFAGDFREPVVDYPEDHYELFVQNAMYPNAGFDKLAAYGKVGNQFRWLIDTDNDGVPNLNVVDPANIIGQPVAGNFDGDASNGDEVGLFTGTTWYFDVDHDYKIDVGSAVPSAIRGYPIVGDFDGDGTDDLAAWRDYTVAFDLAANGFGQLDATIKAGFIGVRERPVAADMDMDGIDDVGLWTPDRAGATPEETGEWFFLLSDDHDKTERVTGTVVTLDHEFSPIPLGQDLFAQFGDEFALPVVGNFDPPVAGRARPGGLAIVNLAGTDGDDAFEFVAGPTPGEWTITLNGVDQGTVSGAAIAVTFDGGEGNDTATLVGSRGPDEVKLWPGSGSLAGVTYSVTVQNVETISVDTDGGPDVASFWDSPGDDSFEAGPGWATLSGPGFSNSVVGAEMIHAYAKAGGTDDAKFDDSPGNDKVKAASEYVMIRGAGFRNRVKFFESVTINASEGKDTIMFWDSSEDDIFVGSAEQSRFYSESVPFDVTGNGFDRVIVRTGNGGIDQATLHDSPGDDVFLGRSHKAQMFDRDTGGEVYDITLRGFKEFKSIADRGGNDIAKLHDSVGDDLWEVDLVGGQSWSTMKSGIRTLYDVLAFEQVKGYSHNGGQNSLRNNLPEDMVDLVYQWGDWTELD